MSDPSSPENTATGLDTVTTGGEALIGMATLGKTAAALALVVVIILLAATLLRRWGLPHQRHGRYLKVVGSTAVGNRERVVIVEVAQTWLVLGVGAGQVNKLHELAAPEEETGSSGQEGAGFSEGDSFGTRFAKALKHNAGMGRGRT